MGATATALTRSPDRFAKKAAHLAHHPAIVLHEGDVRTFEFPPGPFTHVVHAATDADAGANTADPLKMLDTIVLGTRRTLDLAVAGGARRTLLVSSGAIYGAQKEPVGEDSHGSPSTTSPASAYAEGKRMMELMGSIYASRQGLGVTVARPFAFLGPYMTLEGSFAAGNFLRDALSGKDISIRGDGSPSRSYLYASDLAVWLWTVLLRGETGRAYNVGAASRVTLAELATKIGGLVDPPVAARVEGGGVAALSASVYVPEVRRAETELGLKASVPLDEALTRTIRWFRKPGDG